MTLTARLARLWKNASCRVCGERKPPLPKDSIDAILGPRLRWTIGDQLDVLCHRCQAWAAKYVGLIA